MLQINIPDEEYFDEVKEEFVVLPGGLFEFEHSLRKVAEWESRWKIPYKSADPEFQLTPDQSLDYLKTMCNTEGLENRHMTLDVQQKLMNYINDPMTATTFQNDDSESSSAASMTSEVIYAMMAMAGIPFECDRWHFNRLIVLINVIATKNEKPKMMSQEDLILRNRRLNEERKKKYNTKG